MTKYDYAFKKQVVEAYHRGEGGYKTLATRYSIPSHYTVKKWIKSVDTLGFDALHKRKTKQSYSSQFKQDVIHYYLNSGESYLDVALKFGLSSKGLVFHWHQAFLKESIQGLSPKPKGRSSMSKKNKEKNSKKSITHEQELERENELLRAELAFVKKRRALGMNIPDRLKNETPESSTRSEKSSG